MEGISIRETRKHLLVHSVELQYIDRTETLSVTDKVLFGGIFGPYCDPTTTESL